MGRGLFALSAVLRVTDGGQRSELWWENLCFLECKRRFSARSSPIHVHPCLWRDETFLPPAWGLVVLDCTCSGCVLLLPLPWPPALPNLCQFLKGIDSDFSEPLQAAFELFKFSSSCLSWLLFLILQNSSYRFLLHKTSPSAGDLVAPYVLLWH